MDKQVLFKRKAKAATDVVVLDGGPGDDEFVELRIRALSRGEVDKAREGKPDNAVYERRLIAAALIDPVMTYDEVTLWLDGDPDDPDDEGAPAGDCVKVMTAIAELSGLAENAQKSGVPGVRKRRR